jgi:hypothetical protein
MRKIAPTILIKWLQAVFIYVFCLFFNATAQNIAISDQEGYTPDASAMLDVYSINKGMLVPRVALVSTIDPVSGTKPEGLLVWNTSTSGSYPDPGFYYWSGTDWVKVGSSALDFENGLTHSGSTVKLGGTLSESTTITQGSYSMNFDLTGTGDFNILDNGTSAFFVRDDGYVGVGTTTPGHKLEVNGNIKLDDNIMIEGSSAYKVYRNLVSYSASSTSGAFVINTNQPQASNCMFRLKVEGYLYKSSGPLEITVGAYTTGSGSKFYNKGYVNIGSEKLAVRLAINVSTGNLAIILGDTTTTYQYPKLTVTEFCQGHSGRTESNADGWIITQETSLSGYDNLTDVPDVTNLDNRYYTEAEVDGLISGSTFWNRTSGKLFPHTLTDDVGIGTSNPGSRLEVYGNSSGSDEDPLFEVKNNDGQTIFAVYPEGVRIYVNEDVSKGSKGGFAVGGFSTTGKGLTNEYFRITPDTVRIYVDDRPGKGVKGGFAVGGFGTSKGLTNEYLRVTPDSVRIYVDNDPEAKGAKGGFAVGGFSAAKGYEDAIDFMHITPDNYFIGHESGLKTTPSTINDNGKYNNFFGYWAGKENTTGRSNTFIGKEAGLSNSGGYENIFIGNYAGQNVVAGYDNVYIGNSCGAAGHGQYNVYIGHEAGLNNAGGALNVFIGKSAGQQNLGADYNVFVGIESGRNNQTGNYNLYMGGFSGMSNQVGEKNVYLGYDAGSLATTGSGNVFIGHQAGRDENGDNKLYIHNWYSSSPLIYGEFDNTLLRFNGEVGVKRIPVTNALEVSGNASKTTAGDWLANSDRRIKRDIQEIQNSFVTILKLHPVKFKYTDEYKKTHSEIEDKYYYNFVAQEFMEVFPESVKGSGEYLGEETNEILQLDSYNAQIIAIKALQELIKQNEEQQNMIEELKRENSDLKYRLGKIDDLQNQIDQLKDLFISAFNQD